MENCLNIRESIIRIVESILPHDSLEKEHRAETLSWINSNSEIFRIQKPDIPNKHLVSYFCLFDSQSNSILLVEHKKSGLWLPSGGHVEPNEDPIVAAKRECFEELGIQAKFLFDKPIFITSTITVGATAGHTDVSLWYVLNGHLDMELIYDKEEFESIKWFKLDEIPFGKSDPHMRRFIEKLRFLI